MSEYFIGPLKVNGPNGKLIINIPEQILIKSGDIIYISGENGSGKSVFLNLLAGNISYSHSSYKNLTIECPQKVNSLSFVNNMGIKMSLPPNQNNEYDFFSRTIHFQSDDKEDQMVYSLPLQQQFHAPFLNLSNYNQLKIEINYLIRGNPQEKYSLFDTQTQEAIKYPSLYFLKLPYMYKMARIISKRENDEALRNRPIEVANKIFSKLSSGQKQMFDIYSHLLQWEIKHPEVVMFDEPLNYLDIRNRDLVISEIDHAIAKDQNNPKPSIFAIISHCTLFSFLNEQSPFYKKVVHINVQNNGEVRIKFRHEENWHHCGRCHQHKKEIDP